MVVGLNDDRSGAVFGLQRLVVGGAFAELRVSSSLSASLPGSLCAVFGVFRAMSALRT